MKKKLMILLVLSVILALGMVSAAECDEYEDEVSCVADSECYWNEECAELEEAVCGNDMTMHVGESVTYDGQTVTLEAVSASAVVVDVDGTSQTISEGDSETIEGLTISADDLYSRTDTTESTADITIECEEAPEVTEDVECGESFEVEPTEDDGELEVVDLDGERISVRYVKLSDDEGSALVQVAAQQEYIEIGDVELVEDAWVYVVDADEEEATLIVLCEYECSESFIMTVDDKVVVNENILTLDDVSSSAAVLDEDGTSEIISLEDTETIEDLTVTVDDLNSRTERSESSGTFTVECEAEETTEEEVETEVEEETEVLEEEETTECTEDDGCKSAFGPKAFCKESECHKKSRFGKFISKKVGKAKGMGAPGQDDSWIVDLWDWLIYGSE